MRTKRVTNKLLVVLLAIALALTMTPAVAFAGTTGDDGAYYADGTVPDAPDCARVEWNGLIWDIIGYNYNGVKYGVAGDTNGTVTLLLDKASYYADLRNYSGYDSSSQYEYQNSVLQVKMDSIFDKFSDKANVVARDLDGGSALSIGQNGYTGSTVAGNAVSNQKLWPLSTTEASQLKTSVRSYGYGWNLRTPGLMNYGAASVADDGKIYPLGDYVFNAYINYASRPALYLSLTAPIFSSLDFASGNIKIGSYSPSLKATDSLGYTWDIIGVNDNVSKGVPAPKGYATLLLSNQSVKKFNFPNQVSKDSINGWYDSTEPYSNEYSTSDLKNAMVSAYDTIKAAPEYNGNISARSFEGGAIYNDGSENVAGSAVKNQSLWALSVAEAGALTQQLRVFGFDWWLRSPGGKNLAGNTTLAACVYNGFGNYLGSGNVSFASSYPVMGYDGKLAIRPALYLKTSSTLFKSLNAINPNWQSRVSASEHKVTFNSNGGKAVNSITVASGDAIGTLPVSTRTYYKFVGWYTAKTGGTKITSSTVITANKTYYAHWQAAKPKKDAPSSIVNHVDFKKFVKHIASAKKSIKAKKSATIKLTAYKNVVVKSIKLDKKAKKLKLKLTKAKNSIKVKAGAKKGKGKITVTLKNGNKKTITVTIK